MKDESEQGLNTLLYIGAQPESVAATKTAIIEILGCGQEQKTIRVALRALLETCQVNNVAVSSCSFVAGNKMPD